MFTQKTTGPNKTGEHSIPGMSNSQTCEGHSELTDEVGLQNVKHKMVQSTKIPHSRNKIIFP